MKKLFLFVLILSALQSFGQAPDIFAFTPYTVSRVRSSDSVQINFQLATNNPANASIKSITQTAGSSIKFTPAPSWISGTTLNQGFWLSGLTPGTYSFTATGVSGSGTTGTQTVSVVVIPDQVCPPIPPPPAPRLATSVTLMVGGISVTIPASALKIAYADGSSQ